MLRIAVLAACTALSFPAMGLAQANPEPRQAEAAPAAQSTATPSNPNERICRAQTATGSRLGSRRVCRTRAEWAEIARDSREVAEEASRNGVRGSCVAGRAC